MSLTFSVAQQSIVEPDTGIAFQFIPDVGGDTSKNVLRLTRVDADPIELYFDRNGRYTRTEYVVPLDDDDLKARDLLRSTNADMAQASYARSAPLPATDAQAARDERNKAYDAAVEVHAKAQEAYNERERARQEKAHTRGQVGDKVLPMTPPQPGLAQAGAESAPTPAELQRGVVNTRDLQKMQADQSPDTISRTYEPASPDHFDPKGLPQYQPVNPHQLPPNAQRPDSLKDENQEAFTDDGLPRSDSRPQTARPSNFTPKEPVPA